MNKSTISLVEATNGHFYEIKDDELNDSVYLPSSTTILNCFPNPGLDMWKQTTPYEEIKRKQEEGKRQGSKVHAIIQLRIMGQKVLGSGITEHQIKLIGVSEKSLVNYLQKPLTDREEKALVGVENFWEMYRPIVVASELMVFSKKYLYAGTLDFFGYLWNKKTKKYEPFVVDWKISKSLNKGYDLQLASYWKAFEETYKKRIPKAKPGILQLGKNKCNFSFKEVTDKKTSWKMFLNTKEIYDFLHPNSHPVIINRRKEFTALPVFKKRGRLINLN